MKNTTKRALQLGKAWNKGIYELEGRSGICTCKKIYSISYNPIDGIYEIEENVFSPKNQACEKCYNVEFKFDGKNQVIDLKEKRIRNINEVLMLKNMCEEIIQDVYNCIKLNGGIPSLLHNRLLNDNSKAIKHYNRLLAN